MCVCLLGCFLWGVLFVGFWRGVEGGRGGKLREGKKQKWECSKCNHEREGEDAMP